MLDSLGELAAVYSGAAVAFVGGTLAPKGGHNILEPVGVGCPVIFGPRTENVRAAVSLLQECGAGRAVANASQLSEAVAAVLRDPGAWRAAAARGRAQIESHRGSAARNAALIAQTLEQWEPPARGDSSWG